MKGKKKDSKTVALNTQKAVRKTLILTAAYLMEEEGWDAEKLEAFFNDISKWAGALDEHLISMKQVCELVTEKTGVEVKW